MDQSTIDVISTRYQKGKAYFDQCIRSGRIPFCSPGFVGGSCKGGHSFASIQFCGREYCRDCSRDGSPIHQRRVNKWWGYVNKWQGMGYLVITIPESFRHYFYDREQLRSFRSRCLRKLRESYGMGEGLARWHWFGDCANCKGSGCMYCNETGAGDNWHPHLNILVPGAWIDDVNEYLLPLKQWMYQYIKRLLESDIDKYKQLAKDGDAESLGVLDHLFSQRHYLHNMQPGGLVMNYSYVTKEEEKMNRVKYITRSTFRIFNSSVKDLLYNFRNCVVWGWKKSEMVQDDDGLIKYCPMCEEKGVKHRIHWHRLKKFQHNDKIKKHEKKSTGTGGIYSIHRSSERDPDDHRAGNGFISVRYRESKKITINSRVGDEDLWHSILSFEGSKRCELGNHSTR